MTAPRSINSTRPFHSCAQDYIDKGWGVLPLPRRRKEYPPVGFTGRAGKFAEDDDLIRWLNDAQYTEGNIAIRVGNVLVIKGVRYEVIGIDVDNHSGKPGVRDLARLEKKYGRLPDTWISSSRDDGISGIRFYLVPYGYGFKGKASDSIDIVQRVHRYAVVYPSWHPDTKTQYFWYKPGKRPEGQGFTLEIPSADQLPLLPDGWIDYLTANRQNDDQGYGIDLDSSPEEIQAWRKACFPKPIEGVPGGMCPLMKRVLDRQIEKLEQGSSNHDKLTAAHWSMISLAAEGHSGYRAAVEEYEAVWFKDIIGKNKRPAQQVKREMVRSLAGTFRKLKAKAEAFKEQGFQFFSSELCVMDDREMPKMEQSEDGPWIYRVPLLQKEIDPIEYQRNDVSQANHFIDRVLDNVHYLSDYNGWIIYDGTTWHLDDFKHIRDLFDRAVVQFNARKAKSINNKMIQYLKKPGTSDTDVEFKKLEAERNRLNKIADTYRNLPRIKAALECSQSIPGVAMKYSQLNWDTTVLAMPNGKVLKLDEPSSKPDRKALGYRVIPNRKEFFTTYTTAVGYVGTKGLSEHEQFLWTDYLNKFLPDLHYRRFVQKALGYLLIGGNPEKLALFLVGQRNTGKSTILQAIQGALGDYGATFQPNSVFKDSSGGTNPELGNLLHKRGIFSSESGSQRIYANPLKRNTGGDKISVTRKYANDQIIGVPHFVPVVATNQSPTIDDADEALIKRILVCPFETAVDETTNDKRFDVVLERDGRPAVFNWLVQGYRRYIREGINYSEWPDSVKAATKEFASELSDVSTFLNENCELCSDDIKVELNRDIITKEHEKLRKEWEKVTVAGLYQAYRRGTEETNQKSMTDRMFGRKVRQMFGVESVPIRREGKVVKVYRGLKWKDEAIMLQTQS